MSQKNVELVRRWVEAMNRGDGEPELEMVDEGVVLEPLRAGIEGSYSGHEGLKAFWADTRDNFDVFEVSFAEVRDLGDRVLTVGTIRVKGSGSGAETTVPTAAIWAFREGRLIHYKDYGDERAALAAAA